MAQTLTATRYINQNKFYQTTNEKYPIYNRTTEDDNERITEDGVPRIVEQQIIFDQYLTVNRFVDIDVFHTAGIVKRGNIAVTRFVDPDKFYTAAVKSKNALAATRFVDTDSFYQAVVIRGAVTLAATIYHDRDVFYTGSISVRTSARLFVDPDRFYNTTLTTGPVTLHGRLFADPDKFYTSLIEFVNREYHAKLFVDPDIFYPASIVGGSYPRTIYVEDSTRIVASPETNRVLESAEVLDNRLVSTDSRGRVVASTTFEVVDEPNRVVAVENVGRTITTSGVLPEQPRVVVVENKGRTINTTGSDDKRIIAANGKTRKVAA